MAANHDDSNLDFLKDITDFSELQNKIIDLERIIKIGLLTSSITHELNNPITGICTYAEIAKNSTQDQQLQKDLDQIIQAGKRCKNIITGILEFIKPSSDQAKESSQIEPHQIIQNCMDWTNFLLNKTNRISFHLNLSKKSCQIIGDETAFFQIIFNLIHNSLQAIKDSGDIIITTRLLKPPSRKIQITIEDSGQGIAKNNLKKLFDPLFTTKDPQQGTGLGLFVTKSLIIKMSGTIKIKSQLNKGTTATLTFPYIK